MTSRTLAILALLIIAPLAAPDADDAPPPRALTVATFNVRYGLAKDGPNQWQRRRALLASAIGDLGADVLGLQEALTFQIDEITKAHPGYAVLGVGRDDGRARGELSPLLVRTQRFLIAEGATFWLSEEPDTPGSRAWDAAFPRLCTWARLIDRESGQGIYVYNTHFDHVSQTARERSAALILEHIAARSHDDPAILLGDFNAGEDNPAYLALLQGEHPRARLADTYRAIHPAGGDPDETSGTFTGFVPTQTRGAKIDHVLATPDLEILDAAIARPRSPDGARCPSDHDPVTATLRWR